MNQSESPSPQPPITRVLVIDRHALVRNAVRQLLDAEPDLQVVGEAETAEHGIELARSLAPDVTVLGQSQPEPIRALHAAAPATRIVVLGLEDDPNYARRAEAAGAAAYVRRELANGELTEAIRKACERS